jgi:hypothetical protein
LKSYASRPGGSQKTGPVGHRTYRSTRIRLGNGLILTHAARPRRVQRAHFSKGNIIHKALVRLHFLNLCCSSSPPGGGGGGGTGTCTSMGTKFSSSRPVGVGSYTTANRTSYIGLSKRFSIFSYKTFYQISTSRKGAFYQIVKTIFKCP